MVHIKVVCEECGTDVDITCEGIFLIMKNPVEKPEEGFLVDAHNMDSVEMMVEAVRYLVPDIIKSRPEVMNNMNFTEWLKDKGLDLDKKEGEL